ncbi:MAG: N-acetyltransferase [Pseudomonadota bacterium]
MTELLIRPPTKGDQKTILAIVEAAFGDEPVAPIVADLWEDNAMAAEFLAVEHDVPIGYCALSPVTCSPALHGVALGLSPVAVLPSHQRAGVGSALCTAAVRHCKHEGVDLLIVLGHADYYPRFGFHRASDLDLTWSVRDAGDSLMAIDFAGTGRAPRQISFHRAFD